MTIEYGPGHLVTRAHEAYGVGSSLIAGHPGGSGEWWGVSHELHEKQQREEWV